MFSNKEIKKANPDYVHLKINLRGKSLGYLIDGKNIKIKKDFCSTYCEITLDESSNQAEQLVNGVINVFGNDRVAMEGYCNLVLEANNQEMCYRLPIKFDGAFYNKPVYVCKLTDKQTKEFIDDINKKLHINKNLDLKYIKSEVEKLEKIKNDYDRRLRALSIFMQD